MVESSSSASLSDVSLPCRFFFGVTGVLDDVVLRGGRGPIGLAGAPSEDADDWLRVCDAADWGVAFVGDVA